MNRTMKQFHIGCFALAAVSFAMGLVTKTTPNHVVHHMFVSMLFFTLILWPLVMVFYLPYSVAVKAASAIRAPSSNPRAPAGLIEHMCKQTGWVLSSRSGDFYRLRSGDHRSPVEIDVRYSERNRNVVLQS